MLNGMTDCENALLVPVAVLRIYLLEEWPYRPLALSDRRDTSSPDAATRASLCGSQSSPEPKLEIKSMNTL
jgi:hypothetical protein